MGNRWEMYDKVKYEHLWYAMRNETWNEWEKKYECMALWYERANMKTDAKYMSK